MIYFIAFMDHCQMITVKSVELGICVSQQLQQDIQVRSNEAQREGRKKDKLERELRQGKAELDNKAAEIKTLQSQIERYKQDIAKTEQQLKEQRVREYSPCASPKWQ